MTFMLNGMRGAGAAQGVPIWDLAAASGAVSWDLCWMQQLQSSFPSLVSLFFFFFLFLGSVSLSQPDLNPVRIVLALLVTPGHADP